MYLIISSWGFGVLGSLLLMSNKNLSFFHANIPQGVVNFPKIFYSLLLMSNKNLSFFHANIP